MELAEWVTSCHDASAVVLVFCYWEVIKKKHNICPRLMDIASDLIELGKLPFSLISWFLKWHLSWSFYFIYLLAMHIYIIRCILFSAWHLFASVRGSHPALITSRVHITGSLRFWMLHQSQRLTWRERITSSILDNSQEHFRKKLLPCWIVSTKYQFCS